MAKTIRDHISACLRILQKELGDTPAGRAAALKALQGILKAEEECLLPKRPVGRPPKEDGKKYTIHLDHPVHSDSHVAELAKKFRARYPDASGFSTDQSGMWKNEFRLESGLIVDYLAFLDEFRTENEREV